MPKQVRHKFKHHLCGVDVITFVHLPARLCFIIFCCFQTVALQDACQKRINLERISPLFESTADSHVLTGSQFELTSVDRGCSLGEPINCKHGLLCDKEIYARGSSTLELACSTTGTFIFISFNFNAHWLSCKLECDTFYHPIICWSFSTWLSYIYRLFPFSLKIPVSISSNIIKLFWSVIQVHRTWSFSVFMGSKWSVLYQMTKEALYQLVLGLLAGKTYQWWLVVLLVEDLLL